MELKLAHTHNQDCKLELPTTCKACADEFQAKLTASEIYKWGNGDCDNKEHHKKEHPMIRSMPLERRHCDGCWQELQQVRND
jgi:hypothetical protein